MNKQLCKTINTPDKHELDLLHTISKSEYGDVVILLHGLFTDKHENGRFDRFSGRLAASGLDVIRFDFRGHGKRRSKKNVFTLSGALTDFRSVLGYAKANRYKRFHIIGSSFGAGIFLLYIQCEKACTFSSSVLLNPVVDYHGLFTNPHVTWGRLVFTQEKKDQILTNGKALLLDDFTASIDFFNELHTMMPYCVIPSIDFPLLVLHGDSDDRVSHELSVKHFSKNEKCFTEIVPGAGHAFKNEEHEMYVHARSVEWIISQR